MAVTVKGSYIVKPAEPTWTGRMSLSELDQIGVLSHIPVIYFYRPPHNWLTPPTSFVDALKKAFGQVLVPFYPFAGRLHPLGGGRIELECNAAGVQLLDAESESKLEDFGDFSLSPEHEFLVPKVNYTTPLHEQPLFLAQVTRFKCGGVSVGFTLSHALVDGESALHFIKEWARFARGEPLERVPVLDRKLLRAGDAPSRHSLFDHPELDHPPLLLGQSDNSEEKKKKTLCLTLSITKEQVEKLRNKANEMRNSESSRSYSRYETIAGHLWRCATKARGLKPEQQTALDVCADIRRLMQPQLPRSYFGNAIVDVIVHSLSGELVSRPLGYSASKIREAIEKLKGEYVDDAIDFLKNQPELTKFQAETPEGPYYGNPNLSVVSWLTLPFHGLDFGWGKEIRMVHGPHESDGDAAIVGSPCVNDPLTVYICLQEPLVDAFKKYFYEDME